MNKFLLFCITFMSIAFANEVDLVNLYHIDRDLKAEVSITPPIVVDKTTVSNDKDSKVVSFNTDIDTMIYYLIDTSIPMKQSFNRGIRPLISQLDKIKQPKEKWIVSYFDDDIHVVYDDDKKNIETVPNILKLIPVKGRRTELWRNTQIAIKDLASRKSKRKVLVLLSDGDAEDTDAYTRETVIKLANDAGIKIVSLAYRDTMGTQNLRRISEDTGGGFWKANLKTHKLPTNFYREFMKLVKSSGIVSIPSALIYPTETGKLDLNITFEHGIERSVLALTIDTEKIEKVEENTTVEEIVEEDNTTEVIEDNMTVEDNNITVTEEVKPQTFFDKYKLYLAILAALISLILLYLLLRKKPLPNQDNSEVDLPGADFSGKTIVNDATQANDSATVINNAGNTSIPPQMQAGNAGMPSPMTSKPIAYLLAKDGSKYNISHFPTRIGKSTNNDIVISDKFMSRQHATILNKNGMYYIVDNNSSNGVVVNGKKIVGESQIKEGSRISFGPYETTFHTLDNSTGAQFGADDEKTRWVK